MSKQKVAVVTGANKGIGLELVAGLCQRFPGVVYLTSRDEARGREAVAALQARGLHPRYHQLDVTDEASVALLAAHLSDHHGHLDILVNNAGVGSPNDLYNSYEQSCTIIDINYRALLLVERHLFPLLRSGARVLHVSSSCGHLSNLRHEGWLARLARPDLERQDINEFIEWYLKSVKNGSFRREDFADEGTAAGYRVSKISMSALAIVQARELAARSIAVNSVHPGLVRTDITGGKGCLTPVEGARAPLYMVLDAHQDLTGHFVWFDCKVRDWRDPNLDLYFKIKELLAME